jgi:signal peptidase I
MKTLHLTLSKLPFEVMVTGEKTEEFRKDSQWIISRLINKKYDVIKFTNGYGKDKPYFICKYLGFNKCYMDLSKHEYSNGLIVDGIGKGDFIIYLGKIIEKGNIK